MLTTNYSRNCVSVLFFFLVGIASLYGQEKHAQSGMTAVEKNLTSFPVSEIRNIEAWRKYNDPGYYSHPNFGKLPENAPCENCIEVLEKRTVDERYFINLEDTHEFYSQKALGDLHERIDGAWVTIEPALHPVSGTRYESGYLSDQPVIDFSAARTELKTANGTLFFNNWKLIVVQNGAESSQLTANWSDYTVGSDGTLIHNVFPGIDAEMLVQRGGIKTSFIIKTNEFGVFDQLVFREELHSALSPVHAEFSEGTHNRGIGSLKLMTGTTQLALMDEAKLFAKDGPKSLARSGEYVIHANKVDLLVDYDWINAHIGSYQLIVDPLITGTATLAQASITGSRYNASCNFTNSCDYNLTVPCPAGASITDLTFSFTYSANGTTCWLQDGAMRIATGGCTSPSAAGFYWFCNAIGGGTCSATNQTVYTDLAACIPAPTVANCTAGGQNITFTLKFYRSCWGASGCSNTCIGAGSPWVMNIVGRSLEYTNPTTPITLSGTTVCQGGSLTASTSAIYGIPTYNYNWSFSPTGTPSIGTGTSVNITFPTSGSVTLYSIVTDLCGNQITSNRTVTVTPGTPPTIAAGGPTTFCAGGSVTLTSSSATGNTWSNGATTQSITVTTGGSYTVTVVGGGGCSSTSSATVVTVTPLPATPTITPSGPISFCTGGSVTLTSSSATGNTWSTGATTQSINVTTAGTYTLTVTTSGCTSAPASTTITVNPLPAVPTISTGGPTTFCSGGSVTLTSSSPSGNTWSTGATTQSITVSSSGSYTVTVSNGSCSSTSAATVVTVNPLPAVPTISAGGPTTFCSGGSVTLTSSAATGNTWSTGATTQSITVSSSGSYTVTVSNGSCSSASAAVVVTVNPLPAIPTISASGSTTFCAGGSVTLTSSAATGNTWSTTETTQAINVTTSGSYTVTVSSGSCSSTSAVTLVTVNPLPAVPTITAGGPTTFCSGGSVTLTSSSASGNTWSTGATTQSITVSSSGSYTVTVSNGSCSSASAATVVTVNPLPAVPTIAASGPTTFCSGGSVTLTSSAASGNTWSTGATTQSIIVSTGGSYTVTVSNGSCSSASAATIVTVNPLPAVPTIAASGPTTFCSGGSVTLTSSASTGNIWSTGATTQSITVSTGGSYTVTVSASGCSSASAATIVTVNPIPTVTASNNGPLCVNQPLNLTASGTAGGTYSWTGPNSFSSASQNPTIASVTGADFGVYTVTISVNSCTASATTNVTLNSGISTAILAVGPFCANDGAITLSAANPGGNWSGTGIVNPVTGLFDPSVSGPGSFVITYDIPGSCSGASTTTIVVNPLPATDFTADTLSGCAPLSVNFTNQTPSSVNAQWSFGNGQTSASLLNASANYTSAGCFTVSLNVTDLNGCAATFTKVNFICIHPKADASFTPSPYEATITHPEIHFINTSSNATSYAWNFGDGGNSVAFSPTYTYDEVPSNYVVKLTATNAFGCSDTAKVIVRILDELIYYVPNSFTPNGDEHNNTFQPVFTSGFDPYSFKLLIFNRWGETVFESKDAKVGWDGTYNGMLVQEGIYTWTVSFKDPDTDKKYTANGHLTLVK
ncbi:gliding motility-associated C-terminal domain-containing protein [Fluviicola chungangensis]|uniref:T9SS type B sorting domain-containing protein n=1 Tax=Fluviicola chungangensis TaxID=2597671 RepID=A0A556MRG9_9FLAO|nr:gliding motility-associated C-terminal domain-containing protein [Fluviicola chungangensis]TSJ42483.1 T9SS type B sorting domain-containing protein [Fluviicola chungangensis]